MLECGPNERDIRTLRILDVELRNNCVDVCQRVKDEEPVQASSSRRGRRLLQLGQILLLLATRGTNTSAASPAPPGFPLAPFLCHIAFIPLTSVFLPYAVISYRGCEEHKHIQRTMSAR